MNHYTHAQVGHPNSRPLPGWPEYSLEGLFEAMERWTLDPTWEMLTRPGEEVIPKRYDRPYWGAAWGAVPTQWRTSPTGGMFRDYAITRPQVPEHPLARNYTGNFLEVSLGFTVVTDDPALWDRLDAAIARNMARPDWEEARKEIEARRNYRTTRERAR